MRAALAALLSVACYEGFDTELGQLRVDPDDRIVTEPFRGLFPQNNPLLQGTELCATVECSAADPECPSELLVADCFEQTVEGGELVAQSCVLADQVGTLVWRFDPLADLASCGADAGLYAPEPDQATFQVVPASEITATWAQWPEAAAAEWLLPTGISFPTDWTVPDGEPFRVAAGGSFTLPVVLTHPKGIAAVAYSVDAVEISVVTTAGKAPIVTRPEPGYVRVTPGIGTEGEVVVEVDGRSWVAGRFVGVPLEVGTIEVVPAYVSSDGDRLPFAARAVVRDPSGALLYGAPVVWTVTEGALAIEPGASTLPGVDYALLRDGCLPPPTIEPEGRRVSFEASVGDRAAAASMSWGVVVPSSPPDSFRADDFCQDARPVSGCGCASGGPGSALVLGFVVAWAPRRRR